MPSLRERKRYLAFEIVSENEIEEFSLVSDAIKDSIADFMGTYGASEAGILVLEELWSQEAQKGVIKVNNKYVEKLKTCLALVEQIDQQKVIIKSVKVSGNINKAKSFSMAS